MTKSTVIRGGRLLDAANRSAEKADLLVTDGRIAAIGPPGLAAPADAQLFDASHTLMHAGLINGHTHGNTNLSKATHDRWTLELLLSGTGEWVPHQTTATKSLNTTLGAVEMLQKGCTSCYDLTFGFPVVTVDELIAIGQAYVDAGMRAVVAPMLQDISFYQAIPGLFDALPEAHRQAVAAGGGATSLYLLLSDPYIIV